MNQPKSPSTTLQPLTAALYARVSTERQEDEQTIEVQIAEIKERIAADGHTLPKENIFLDDGWSGAILQRPGLDTMRSAALERKFDVLYVYDRGRLARKYHYQEIVIEELQDRDIQFISLKDRAVESEDDRVIQGIQGLFSEWERTKITERFRIGKLQRAKAGRLINGQVPYGYIRFRKDKDTPATVSINEEEATVIRKIFQWVGDERLSMREVRRRLHDEGIPPQKGKNEYWTKGPIHRLLQNETYIDGVVYYNKSEAIVAKKPIKNRVYKRVKKTSRRMRGKENWIPYQVPIILQDRDLFERVQKILNDNKRQKVAHPKYEYLLTGLIWCACGMRRVGDGSSRHGHCYYRCAERLYRFETERTCFIAGLNAAALDFVFWNELTALLNDPERLGEHADLSNLEAQKEFSQTDSRLARLHELATQIDAEMERYSKAYGAGALELEQLQQLMRDAKQRKASHLNQIKKAERATKEVAVPVIPPEVLIEEASQVAETLDTTDKKAVIRDIIDKVIVREDNDIEVCGHIDLKGAAREGLGSRATSRYYRSAERG